MANLYNRIETYENGEILTGPQLNDEFDNIIDKQIGTYIQSGMDTAVLMQATSDPYPADTADPPSNLLTWQKQVNFQLDQIIGSTYWYEDPEWDLNGAGFTIIDGIIARAAGGGNGYYQHNSALTNAARGLKLLHTTTGDMVDDFGFTLNFLIEDDADVENVLGKIQFTRNGADNTGLGVVQASLAGVDTDMLRIDPTSTKFVGPGDDNATNLGDPSYEWANGYFGGTILLGGDISLKSDNASDLGSATLRFAQIHSYDGHFYDDLTVDSVLYLASQGQLTETSYSTTANALNLTIDNSDTATVRYVDLNHYTDQNMGDDFGIGLRFIHRDSASVEEPVAYIYTERVGADDDAANLTITATSSLAVQYGVVFKPAGGTPSIDPNVDNTIALGRDSHEYLEVWATDTTINTSDKRRKTDIEDCNLGLGLIEKLKPISFRWKETQGRAGVRRHHGFVAQDIEEALVELGVDTKDFACLIKTESGRYATRLGELTAVLVKGIQELSNKVKVLEGKLWHIEG